MALAFLTTGGCASQKKIYLWNGRDFTGWKRVLSDENVDVDKVWSVRNGVIHCKGKPNGYMRTQGDYSNYKLHLEWRWAEKPTNSGVLLHMSGPDKVWPRSIECQLMHENAGDFVLIGGTGISVGGKLIQDTSKEYIVVPKKEQSSEKAAGQAITLHVNGVLQSEGTKATDTSGRICLQSEGSPIEFRNIYIEHLD
jgi:hypothetical protein